MRKRLVAAVALAPLCFAADREAAMAQVTVTGGNNVSTAAASSSGAGDLNITGSVGSSSSTPAVLLNSNNSVSNSGTVSISGVNNSVGIQANTTSGPFTGSITNLGTVSNDESYNPTVNSNGLNEAPFASPTSTGRYGIQLIGKGLTGDIDNDGGTISVRGDNSYAISIEAPLLLPSAEASTITGTAAFGLTNIGAISYTGDNGAAIRSTAAGTIAGNVFIGNTVTSLGQYSQAIDLEGAVGGRISIYSTVTSTGYSTTTRPVVTTTLQSVQSNADQVQKSGAAVSINGGVGGGIFIGAPPANTTTSTATTTDLDGDGEPDVTEGVGAVINYGSAPALSIGNNGTTGVSIGAVGGSDTVVGTPNETSSSALNYTGTAANGYGLIIRGEVTGQGTYDGVSATGLQIGSNNVNAPVTLTGGVRITGSVSADSYLANATAINILAGANMNEIRNEDFIEASVSNSSASATNNFAGTDNPNAIATGISIASGATVSVLSNYGSLLASANGNSMSTTAVVDYSGTLTKVLNEGVISAVVTPTTTGLVEPDGIALDLSHSSNAITLIQQVDPTPIAVEVSTTTSASGTVTTTADLTTATASVTTTVVTTTAGVTTTTTTTTPTYPEIIGDILLGTGANNVQLLGGSVTGNLNLGGGTGDNFVIDNGAIYTGALTNQTAAGVQGTGLTLNVNNGTLFNTSTAHLNLSSLNIGSKGVLYAAIDPASGTNGQYNVTGAATLASGAQIGVVLKSPLFTEQSYTIVTAGQLADSSGGALATANVPYVLVGTETSNAANGTISIDLRRRTAAEMGLDPAESSALNAVYSSLPNDAAIEATVLGQYSRSGFLGVYDQMLPDYSGGVFQLTLAASDAVTRATSRINDIDNPSGTRGAWAEEVAFGVNHNRDQTAGYQGGGFGFVGGLEAGGAGLGAFGLTGAFLTGDVKDPHLPGENLQSFSEGEFGGYWQAQLGGLRADARVGAGYLDYSDRRELLVTDSTGSVALDRTAKASSTGYTATGHFGLGYQTPVFGRFYFRPQVRGDYFYLYEGGFTEHGGGAPTASSAAGGDGFDLTVDSRKGNEASGTASLVTGLTFGQTFHWRPELEVGYRDVFTGTAGDTTAAFASGGSSFTLTPDQIKGGGPLARLNIKADTDFYELNFEAGAEDRTHFTEGDVRLSVRVLF
jgi:hypothetical protein